MKRLIAIVFFTITNLGFAQSYKPLLEEGKFWDVICWQGGISNTYGKRMFVQGDSIFNNITYKIIKYHPMLGNYGGVFYPRQINEAVTHIEGLMREDVQNKKVYSLIGSDDILIYDFNLNVGESIAIFGENRTLLEIEDYIYPDGTIVKKFNFENYYNSPSFYIEGIGSCDYLLNTFSPHFEDGCSLENFQTLSKTDLINDSQIEIIPNPFQDSFSLNIKNDSAIISSLEIYNVLGENLLSISNVYQENFINLKFQKGIYILCVISNDGKIFTKKLIKE